MLESQELNAFIAVAKHLNFSKAASEIGLSAPQFSKVILQLEDKLKVRLLLRSTRSVRLTDEGRVFLQAALDSVRSIRQAEQLFESPLTAVEMAGNIRLTAPTTFATRMLAKPLAEFQSMYPKIEVKVILSDHYLDFIEHNLDVGIRIMNPVDSEFIAKKLLDNRIGFYATPDYIKKHPPIERLEDLLNHRLYAIAPHWNFYFEKKRQKLKYFMREKGLEITNGDLLVELACEGAGLVVRSEWGVRRELELGRLVQIELPDRLVSESAVFIIYPRGQYLPLRLKSFVQVLKNHFGRL